MPDNAGQSDLETSMGAFVKVVDDLYGHYLDSTMGFFWNERQMNKSQEDRRKRLQITDDLDEFEFVIGHGSPNDANNRILHRVKEGEFKRRNAKGGKNYRTAAQLLIVLIYTFWEHEHRPAIAKAISTPANEVKIPIMGDIRLLRHDVIHNGGLASKSYSCRLEVLRSWQDGVEINYDEDSVERIIRYIQRAMDDFVIQRGLPDPEHRKLWRIR